MNPKEVSAILREVKIPEKGTVTDHWDKQIQKTKKKLKVIDRQEMTKIKKENKQFLAKVLIQKNQTKCIRKFIIPEKYIISVKHQNKRYWDLFILFLAFWNSIITPLEMAYNPPFAESL